MAYGRVNISEIKPKGVTVYRGEAAFPMQSYSTLVPIDDEVDFSKSVVIYSVWSNTNRGTHNAMFEWDFIVKDAKKYIKFFKNSEVNNNIPTIFYQILQFDDAEKVQRGRMYYSRRYQEQNPSELGGIWKPATIEAVNPKKSFLLYDAANYGLDTDFRIEVNGKIVDENTIGFQAYSDVSICYAVVSFK